MLTDSSKKVALGNRLLLKRNDSLSDLKSSTSWLDYKYLLSFINRANSKKISKIEDIQTRKLLRLKETQHSHSHKPEDIVLNLSRRTLTDTEISALSKGLAFALPPKRLDYAEYLGTFEKCFQNVKLYPVFGDTSITRIKSRLREIALNAYHSYRPPRPSGITCDELEAIKKLSEDPTIVVLRPDKGNGVVIMDKTTYTENLLADERKFKQHEDVNVFELCTKQEDKLIRLLSKLKKDKVIDKSIYNKLTPTGSKPGILYGLPKTHKPNIPMRPILSTIGTFNYQLAKFLVSILTPISFSKYCVENSFHFVEELAKLQNASTVVMASFDVKSLFTNIPLSETIDICLELLYNTPNNSTSIDRNNMRSLLEIAAKESYFLFNKKIYNQVDGVAMGSPLGPTFANIFMSYHEKAWLADCPSSFKPLMYRRYVDDTFLLFSDSSHITQFLQYLNSKHPNIEFTSETEKNNTISFLDVKIHRSDKFHTSIY